MENLEFDTVSMSNGDVIFTEGEISNYLYIVLKGKVKILVNSKGKLMPVSSIGEKDFIGELSLFNNEKRTASAIAVEDTELALVKKSELNVILKNCPDWVENIMLTLTDRLKQTTFTLSENGINSLDENEKFINEDDLAFYMKNIRDYKKRRGIT